MKGGGYVKYHKFAFGLLIIGGLNWLLQGLLNKDLFVLLGMSMTDWAPRIVYLLVGASAVCELLCHKKLCRMCNGEMKSGMQSGMRQM